MKVNNSAEGTTLTRNRLKKMVSSKRAARYEAGTTSWNTHGLTLEKIERLMPFGPQSQQTEDRAAHIEELQKQVTAGIYTIDSALLAKSMLTDQTHFLDESWD
jgi:anti-sigma28 factor (negative regulator of flagellin synthesis)